MKTPDQKINNPAKQEIDQTQKQDINLLSDDELDAVAGGTTNFETPAGKAFLQGFRRTASSE